MRQFYGTSRTMAGKRFSMCSFMVPTVNVQKIIENEIDKVRFKITFKIVGQF